MTKLNLVGISGQAGSGKDTVADYLCAEHGFTKVALADPIKRFGYFVFLFSHTQLWGPSTARNAIDSRYSTDQMWDEAQGRLEAYGPTYVRDVLGTDDVTVCHDAYTKLVQWFFWLRATHKELSPRIMLQTLGTEWGRDVISNSLWMDYMLRTARTLLHADGNTKHWSYDPLEGCVPAHGRTVRGVIVSDIRFENELRKIHDLGGLVIRVIRPDTDNAAATLGVTGHASEAHAYSFDDFDLLLNNEGTLNDLYNAVDIYMLTRES